MSSDESNASQAVGIEEGLQNPQVSRVYAIFLNRKPLEVRYYFEDKETEGLIMIDVNSLLPIFGGFRPPAARSFETLDKLSTFVQENFHFNECSDYRYADCICHLLANRFQTEYPQLEMFPSSGCPLRHFHHACGSCVNLWLNEYLRVLILRRESRPLFNMAAQEICSRVPLSADFDDYYNRECPEFYLRIAQRLSYLERDDTLRVIKNPKAQNPHGLFATTADNPEGTVCSYIFWGLTLSAAILKSHVQTIMNSSTLLQRYGNTTVTAASPHVPGINKENVPGITCKKPHKL
ncbi:repeat element 21 [Diadegma semiclausum ichnovirus]|nr:repeat element 21 [Diadegma semiclausum ichnovirus]